MPAPLPPHRQERTNQPEMFWWSETWQTISIDSLCRMPQICKIQSFPNNQLKIWFKKPWKDVTELFFSLKSIRDFCHWHAKIDPHSKNLSPPQLRNGSLLFYSHFLLEGPEGAVVRRQNLCNFPKHLPKHLANCSCLADNVAASTLPGTCLKNGTN